MVPPLPCQLTVGYYMNVTGKLGMVNIISAQSKINCISYHRDSRHTELHFDTGGVDRHQLPNWGSALQGRPTPSIAAMVYLYPHILQEANQPFDRLILVRYNWGHQPAIGNGRQGCRFLAISRHLIRAVSPAYQLLETKNSGRNYYQLDTTQQHHKLPCMCAIARCMSLRRAWGG